MKKKDGFGQKGKSVEEISTVAVLESFLMSKTSCENQSFDGFKTVAVKLWVMRKEGVLC